MATANQTQTAGSGARRASGRPRGGRHAARRGSASSGASPRLHLGRIAVLVLLLIGASFYVSPLRAFFSQQDRYQHESEALAAAKAQNDAYKVQVELLNKRDYVAQVARADSMLVPPGTQVFVIKGLPGRDAEAAAQQPVTVPAESISVFDRVDDLWRTLLN
jgi:cell division protein FtsB